jgi:hypothetical protein
MEQKGCWKRVQDPNTRYISLNKATKERKPQEGFADPDALHV